MVKWLFVRLAFSWKFIQYLEIINVHLEEAFSMKQTSHSAKSFTLVELLIVVAIIGLLAAIAIPGN